jgi:hypothetical protein
MPKKHPLRSPNTSGWDDDAFWAQHFGQMAPYLSGRAALSTMRRDTELGALLERDADRILNIATAALAGAELRHYADLDEERLRELIAAHVGAVTRACATYRIEPILNYVERLTAERFASRFDLHEIQTAFNVVAGALWRAVLAGSGPETRSRALAIISTVTGIAKDALACRYLALASKRPPRVWDSRRLFQGTQESLADVWAETDGPAGSRGEEM